MRLRFTKMHGLGNDFVVIDAIRQQVCLSADQYRFLADRHLGVGCDQILLVEQATHPAADFRYRIFNADGSEVEQCGNGARCFVRFVTDSGLTTRREIRVETLGGLIEPRLEVDGLVTVNMGVPRFDPAAVPFVADAQQPVYALALGDETVEVSVLSVGNPHAVQFVADVAAAPVGRQGPMIEHHARFPSRVNAGFAQVADRSRLLLRVYERGAGETLACGTGACAAAVAAMQRGLVDAAVVVTTRGGDLRIQWAGEGQPIWMTGAAVAVFDGEIEI